MFIDLALKFTWRSRLVLGEAILAVVCGSLAAATAGAGLHESGSSTELSPSALSSFVSAVFAPWDLAGLGLALVLGASVVRREMQRGRPMMWLAGPMSRDTFLLQSWAAVVMIVLAHFAFGTVVGSFAMKLVAGVPLPEGFWTSVALKVSVAITAGSVALGFSLVFPTVVAAPLSFALLVLPSWFSDYRDHPNFWARILSRTLILIGPPTGRHGTGHGLVAASISRIDPRPIYMIAGNLCYAALALCCAIPVLRKMDIGLERD